MTGRPTGSPTGERLLELVLARPARLPSSRLVCVDGPAGSGKTTAARALVAAARGRGLSATLVHMDDLYEGWTGMAAGIDRARTGVVEPLARGAAAGYARFDWHRDEYAEHHDVPPDDLVVVEGVGAADADPGGLATLTVWVEAPPDVRLGRGLERDGEAAREHWLRWMADEERHHAARRTRERADVHLDGTTGRLTVSQGMPRNWHWPQ